MHLLMINLILTSVTNEELRQNDIVFGGVSLVFAFLIIPRIGCGVMGILKAKIQEAERMESPFSLNKDEADDTIALEIFAGEE